MQLALAFLLPVTLLEPGAKKTPPAGWVALHTKTRTCSAGDYKTEQGLESICAHCPQGHISREYIFSQSL
jgi:hypothetical protein